MSDVADQRYDTRGGEPPTEQVVVVYRPDDGTIVHVHRVITETGGEPTSDEDAVKAALELAREVGGVEGDAEAMLTIDLDPYIPQRVDVANGQLVEVDPVD